jgi:hypothetical protein
LWGRQNLVRVLRIVSSDSLGELFYCLREPGVLFDQLIQFQERFSGIGGDFVTQLGERPEHETQVV